MSFKNDERNLDEFETGSIVSDLMNCEKHGHHIYDKSLWEK